MCFPYDNWIFYFYFAVWFIFSYFDNVKNLFHLYINLRLSSLINSSLFNSDTVKIYILVYHNYIFNLLHKKNYYKKFYYISYWKNLYAYIKKIPYLKNLQKKFHISWLYSILEEPICIYNLIKYFFFLKNNWFSSVMLENNQSNMCLEVYWHIICEKTKKKILKRI